MGLQDVQKLKLPVSADMHVHLRQGKMMDLVVPQIRKGGVDTVFVMPNLQPPVTTVAQAMEYKRQLQAIDGDVNYLMSLFLHPSVTPEVVEEAAAAGIAGIKLYPQGVTTNSDAGVSSFEDFFPTFAAMERHDIVLNLHGEVINSLAKPGMSLEEAFLPSLREIHERFPKLRIVLEHCSTSAALEAVRACGPTVAATITAHHLYLTEDHSREDPLAFCKPIPKTPADRDALIRAVCGGDSKFFFGSDSAPHPLPSKTQSGQQVPAGVFTQPFVTQLVILALEEAVERGIINDGDVTEQQLGHFMSTFGRRFYKLPDSPKTPGIILERKGEKIPRSIESADGSLTVGISRADASVFSLEWVAE